MGARSATPHADSTGSPAAAGAIDQIATARAAFVDAIGRQDASAIAALYDEEARLVAPALDTLRGRASVAAFWRAGVDSGISDVELQPDDVEVTGAIAWEVGRYALRLLPEGGVQVQEVGRYLLIYALEGERWQRAAEMFRPDPNPDTVRTAR